jgi:GntR family transcriptional regulator, vanillate catabolism transcriptional regulator
LSQEYVRMAALPFAGPSSFVLGQSASAQTFARFTVAQDQHRQVIEAIAARQGTRAESLMREHAAIAQRNLQDSLEFQTDGSTEGRQAARMVQALAH